MYLVYSNTEKVIVVNTERKDELRKNMFMIANLQNGSLHLISF